MFGTPIFLSSNNSIPPIIHTYYEDDKISKQHFKALQKSSKAMMPWIEIKPIVMLIFPFAHLSCVIH